MREVTTYVAYDNTEFDNREECEAYESEAFDLLEEVVNSYRFFVNNQEFLIFPNDIEVGLYILGKAFDKCDKILVVKPISNMALRFIDFQLGYFFLRMSLECINMIRMNLSGLKWTNSPL